MKVKILLIPLVLVIVLAVVIWKIVPEYFTLRVKLNELAKEKTKIEDIDDKISKSEVLMNDLQKNAEKQEILVKFLPDVQGEEEIIDNVNYIASTTGLSVFNLSVSKPKRGLSLGELDQGVKGIGGESVPMAGLENGPDVVLKPKVINFEVKIGLVGNYEKVKIFLDSLYKLRRFNKVGSLTVKQASSSSTGDQASLENLQLEIVAKFNYLEKMKSADDINSPIFTAGAFDMSIIDKIEVAKTTKMLKLNAEAPGKANPFMP